MNTALSHSKDLTTPVIKRIQNCCEKIIIHHLPVLLVLAHSDSAQSRQTLRHHANALINCLLNFQTKPTLEQNGKTLLTTLETQPSGPQLTFNARWVGHIDDHELRIALAKPIATLLKMPQILVVLALREDDPRQLRNIYTHAVLGTDTEPLSITSIPALVKTRLKDFERILTKVLPIYRYQGTINLIDPQPLIDDICYHMQQWPEWKDIMHHNCMLILQNNLNKQISAQAGLPPISVILELAWESFSLFPQSFLAHLAQKLRATCPQTTHWTSILDAFFLYYEERDSGLKDDVSAWQNYKDLNDSWRTFQHTRQKLLRVSDLQVHTAPLSVLLPPQQSIGFQEPDSLPWELPLLAWSAREKTALKDFLTGLCLRTTSDESVDREVSHGLFHIGSVTLIEPPLHTASSLSQSFSFQLENAHRPEQPPPPPHLAKRATEASMAAMLVQCSRLDSQQELSVLNLLRNAYSGCFPQATPLWSQVFGTASVSRKSALFETLIKEIQKHYPLPILLNPFEHPDSVDVLEKPSFDFIACFTPHSTHARVMIPLSLLAVAAQHNIALRLRSIKVDPVHKGPCEWLNDTFLLTSDLHNWPLGHIFDAVTNDMLHVRVSY